MEPVPLAYSRRPFRVVSKGAVLVFAITSPQCVNHPVLHPKKKVMLVSTLKVPELLEPAIPQYMIFVRLWDFPGNRVRRKYKIYYLSGITTLYLYRTGQRYCRIIGCLQAFRATG
jgi:hypothetical protein